MSQIFYVAPGGDDAACGSAREPLRTLTGARNAIRKWRFSGKELPAGGFEIVVAPGTYTAAETFELEKIDSGSAEAPIVYRGEASNSVTFCGGVRLKDFKAVADPAILARLPEESRHEVRQCDLKKAGISDWGKISYRGGWSYLFRYGNRSPEYCVPAVELYCNGRRMTLARWPKSGFVAPRRIVQAGETCGQTSVLEYDSPRHERWIHAEEPWLGGYFRWLWADDTVKLSRIDPEKKQLIFVEPYSSADGSLSDRQGIRYYAFNLLEELSEPGDWYLNRKTGILYFYPPCDLQTATVELNLMNQPMVRMEKVSSVSFRNLNWDLGRGKAILMENCSGCTVAGCRVTRFGGSGIEILNGSHCRIADCEISSLGRNGIQLQGGDRETLVPGANEVCNCRIHDVGCIDRTYTPAVLVQGVGNRVAGCQMYNCPSSALRVEGNEHLIEYNEIFSAVLESDDQGAVDVYGNPTFRNCHYRYNYFHDIGNTDGAHYVQGACAIRFDDAICGMFVYGNIFERCSNGSFGAVQINAGRDNRIYNNFFRDCRYCISGGWSPANNLYTAMRAGKPMAEFFFNDLYRTRYPELREVLIPPGGNYCRDNIFCGCGLGLYTPCEQYFVFRDNCEMPGFEVKFAEAMAEGQKRGIPSIPRGEIGLHHHPDCAWEPMTFPAIRRPADWKKSAGQVTFCGDAVMDPVWRVFGPFDREAVLPDEEKLTACPREISIGGMTYLPRTVTSQDGMSDLSQFLEKVEEGKVFWVYTTLNNMSCGANLLGAGFDWWGDMWIDGRKVFSTGGEGNGIFRISAVNHMFTVNLSGGTHQVAVRLVTGSCSGRLALAGTELLRRLCEEQCRWLVRK